MPFNGFFFVKDSPAVLLVYCSAYRSSWGIYELDEFRSLVCILNASTDESHVSMFGMIFVTNRFASIMAIASVCRKKCKNY